MSTISIYQLGSKVAVLKKTSGVYDLIPSLYNPSDIGLKRVSDTIFRAEIKNSTVHTGTFDTFGSNKKGLDTLSSSDLIDRFTKFGLNDEEPNLYEYLQELDVNGDYTGNINANSNFQTETLFALKHVDGQNPLFINRIITTIADSGSLDASRYGNGVALTNGLLVQKLDKNGNVLIDFTGGFPILTNTDWGSNCYDSKPSDYGSGDNYILARWTFTKDSNARGLRLEDGEQIVIKIGIDNLNGLTGHKFKVIGTKEI